ncbi:MAG: hypothetical protein CL843_14400 [Crocinitomicaceae bacterium]|nr:hypothetical protein [Crocinitomicaceae bacterium]
MSYRVLLGIDSTPGIYNNAKIAQQAKRRRIPKKQLYVLDTISYRNAVIASTKAQISELKAATEPDSNLLKRTTNARKDNLQPTQIRFFNADGSAFYKMVNCYVDPPIPMSWNKNGTFNTFPPKTVDEQLTYGNEDLGFFLEHIVSLNGEHITKEDLPQADYYAVLIWNKFYNRPSKRLIDSMKRYQKKHDNINIHFLYVNNQNAQIWPYLNSEQKKLVFDALEKANSQQDS